MKSIIPILCLLMSIILSSCVLQKPIEPEFIDYIGEWQSDTYAIEIFQNGSATYNSNKLSFTRPRDVEGRVKIDGDRIKVIGEEGRVRLKIDQEPQTAIDPDTGEEYLYMILEGEELRRTD